MITIKNGSGAGDKDNADLILDRGLLDHTTVIQIDPSDKPTTIFIDKSGQAAPAPIEKVPIKPAKRAYVRTLRGKGLRQLRAQSSLSRLDWAAKLGISPGRMHDLENERVAWVTDKMRKSIETATGRTLNTDVFPSASAYRKNKTANATIEVTVE